MASKAPRVLILQRRRQDIVDDVRRCLRSFAEILSVITAPVFQNRRFTKAHQSIVRVQFDNDVNADRGRQARPLVHAAGRQPNRYGFDIGDLHRFLAPLQRIKFCANFAFFAVKILFSLLASFSQLSTVYPSVYNQTAIRSRLP